MLTRTNAIGALTIAASLKLYSASHDLAQDVLPARPGTPGVVDHCVNEGGLKIVALVGLGMGGAALTGRSRETPEDEGQSE